MIPLREDALSPHRFRSLRRQLPLLAAILLTSTLAAQTGNSGKVASELRQGEAALKANDQTAAAQHFESALHIDPENAEAHANLGAIAFFHGDCQAATPHLRAAFQSTPSLTKVQALLSVCEAHLGDPNAVSDMESAFNKLEDPKLRLQIGMELANIWYQRGDFEKTASILRTLLSLEPENVDVLFFAQRVYSELADNTLNKLAVLSPHSARMEQLIAERLINAGDSKDAARHYRQAIQLDPRLPGLHYELAETLLEDSPHDAAVQKEALDQLNAALQLDGDSARIEVQFGRLASLQSNTTEAQTHFQRAYQLDPSNAEALMGLAEIYRLQQNAAEAARYLRLAVKADPFNAQAHYELSQVDRQIQPVESEQELKLFLDLRATQDKVKQLYREMNPDTAAANPAASSR